MTRRLLLGAALAGAVIGCDAGAPPAGEPMGDVAPQTAGPEPTPPAAPDTVERPAARTDTLWLEGMPEPFRLELYTPPLEPPIAFSTYVPEDMVAEPVETGGARGARFIAAFGGQRNEAASLALTFFPPDVTESEARRLVEEVARSRGLQERRADAPARFEWSLAEFDFMHGCERGACRMGTVALGEHGGRFFQVLWSYPEDYAEGFGPRADLILRELRWLDTGRGLRP